MDKRTSKTYRTFARFRLDFRYASVFEFPSYFYSEVFFYYSKRYSVWLSQSPIIVTIYFLLSSKYFAPLSPGQTIATCQRNISQHCWAQHVVCVWPPRCDVLRHVGCCWLKFENGQICTNNTQQFATCRNRVAKRTQHVAPNNVAMCCVGMLRSFGRGFKCIIADLIKYAKTNCNPRIYLTVTF